MKVFIRPTFRTTTVFFCILIEGIFCEGIWSWLFSKSTENHKASLQTEHGSALGKLASVPFEMRTADEKFLLEAQKYGLILSDLDLCHHKVIMQLKKSCSSLTEEDIGKLSVSLLNCQSAVEGRPTFTCTERMSLRECTQDMDQNTWNSYHIVSNRARAVCYASRQQQFTAKTEMTVNKLVFTAEHQLDSLRKLEDGQNKVHDMTNKTLNTMASGQQDLMVKQEKLKLSQQEIHSFISWNLRELTREKRLIAAGQKELADMTEAIKRKLDRASKNVEKNELERQNNHQEILRDLQTVHTKAKDVWEKLENSTEHILQQHAETATYYRETLENLNRINSSINYLMNLLDQTRAEVDVKLGWLTSLIGGAGDQLQVIYCLTMHGIYLTVGALIAAFLQVPTLTRFMLLIVVSGNAFLEVRHLACLDLMQVTSILLATLVGHWIIGLALVRVKAGHQLEEKRSFLKITNSVNRTSTPIRSKTNTTNGMEDKHKSVFSHGKKEFKEKYDVDQELSQSSIYENQQESDNSVSDVTISKLDTPAKSSKKVSMNNLGETLGARKDLLSLGLLDLSSRTVNRSRSQTPTRRLSGSKKLCSGLSKTGAHCRAVCTDQKAYCHRHISQQESEI